MKVSTWGGGGKTAASQLRVDGLESGVKASFLSQYPMAGRKRLGFPPQRELHPKAKARHPEGRRYIGNGFDRYHLVTYPPLPPVLSISVKTKGLGHAILASISKQRTY